MKDAHPVITDILVCSRIGDILSKSGAMPAEIEIFAGIHSTSLSKQTVALVRL